MEGILSFMQRFGTLIDIGLFAVIVGYLFRLHMVSEEVKKNIIASKESSLQLKDTVIEVLNQRLELLEEYRSVFGIENVAERVEKLKYFIELEKEAERQRAEEIEKWYKSSLIIIMGLLGQVKKQHEVIAYTQEQIESLENRLSKEKEQRERLKRQLSSQEQILPKLHEIVGTYEVLGRSPEIQYLTRDIRTKYHYYHGTLDVMLKPDFGLFTNIFDLRWEILTSTGSEIHHGTGFLLSNFLVAIFRVQAQERLYGTVAYRIVSQEVLRGVWLGYNGDVTGEEELRKVGVH